MAETKLDMNFIKKKRILNNIVNNNAANYLNVVSGKASKTPSKLDSHSKKQLMVLINLYVQSRLFYSQGGLNEKVNNYISRVISPRITYCIGDLESSEEHKKVRSVIKILVNEKNMLMEISTNVLIFLKAISSKVGNRNVKVINKGNFNTMLKDLDDNLSSFSMYEDIMNLASELNF